MSEWMDRYRGYSYFCLLDSKLAHFVWRRLFCPTGWHLWDEVLSSHGSDPDRGHYLYCDACGETMDVGCVNCE